MRYEILWCFSFLSPSLYSLGVFSFSQSYTRQRRGKTSRSLRNSWRRRRRNYTKTKSFISQNMKGVYPLVVFFLPSSSARRCNQNRQPINAAGNLHHGNSSQRVRPKVIGAQLCVAQQQSLCTHTHRCYVRLNWRRPTAKELPKSLTPQLYQGKEKMDY